MERIYDKHKIEEKERSLENIVNFNVVIWLLYYYYKIYTGLFGGKRINNLLQWRDVSSHGEISMKFINVIYADVKTTTDFVD